MRELKCQFDRGKKGDRLIEKDRWPSAKFDFLATKSNFLRRSLGNNLKTIFSKTNPARTTKPIVLRLIRNPFESLSRTLLLIERGQHEAI